MVYDLLIKNGRIIDGSGMPAFHGDVAVSGGKIVELGRLDGPATRVIDAEGNVIAPGFIDNHCHYDAQVTWDPLCTYSCYHGATSVIIGRWMGLSGWRAADTSVTKPGVCASSRMASRRSSSAPSWRLSRSTSCRTVAAS